MNYIEKQRRIRNFVLAHDTICSKIDLTKWNKYFRLGGYRKLMRLNIKKNNEYNEMMRTMSGKLSSLNTKNVKNSGFKLQN